MDLISCENYSINVGGRIVDLSSPKVMSIINVTPDSFWSDSRKQTENELITSVEKAINEGADMIDIGGYSSRPGAAFVTQDEELVRVISALEIIKSTLGELPVALSIDTFRGEVVKRVYELWGAFIVNDISAGEDDKQLLSTVAELNIPYIAMHKKGNPQTMHKHNDYGDIVGDIIAYFVDKLATYKQLGIKDVIVDIGFGFAKNIEQNFELIRRYDEFRVMGLPTLAGISRKKMIWQTLDIPVHEALNGTTVLNWELLRGGANILRVHDTKEATETIKLFNKVTLLKR